MTKTTLKKHRVAVLLAGLVTGSVIVAFTAAIASADGRELTGTFCGNRCISLTFDDATTTSTNRTDFTLRPGTYWPTVNDNSTVHNFSLRGPDGTAEEITTPAENPGLVTVKMLLKQGSYRLFCRVSNHEAQGMFVDFEVGGEGQVDEEP